MRECRPRLASRNRPLCGNVSAGLHAKKATKRMVIPFAITSDLVGVVCQLSRMASSLIRSLTQQTARKASAHMGCNKNGRSLCCAPWHRRMTTTGVARLAIIPFLSATRLMADLIRGSLCKEYPERLATLPPIRHRVRKDVLHDLSVIDRKTKRVAGIADQQYVPG